MSENTQQQNLDANGPSTDLSVSNQPVGTVRVEGGRAYDVSGKDIGAANETAPAPIDYDALAKKYGSVGSEPVLVASNPSPATPAPIDYDALAKKHGSIGSEPAPQPAKQAQPNLGRFQGVADVGKSLEEFLSGVGGEVFQTAQGAKNIVNKVLPQSAQIPDIPIEYRQNVTPAEKAGGLVENVGEFMTGEELLKGMSNLAKIEKLAQDSPAIAKLLKNSPELVRRVLAGGAKAGIVGGAQGAVKGAAEGKAAEGAEGGAIGGAIGGATGEVLGAAPQAVKAVKNFVTRNPQIEEMGQKLVQGLTDGATPEQVAKTVGKNLADAEENMHSTYDKGLKAISAQGKDVPIAIQDSPLQQTAKQLLSDSNIPESVQTGLKGVIPDTAKIEPFLTQLSESNETMSWDEMEATRQKIGQTIRKLPWDSPIRPDLIKLRYAIDDTLEGAADKAGNSDLSDQIKSLRSEYAQTKGALEERAIVALKDKNPNAIADVLLNKQSVHNVQTLRRLIGSENMNAVEGSILDKMIQDASKNGELQGRQLFRKFNSLGPDAKQAIWGNRLPQVEEFMKQAGKLQNVVLDKIISHYAPYALGTTAVYSLAHGDVKGAAAIGSAAALSALLRNPYVLEAAVKGAQAAAKAAPAIPVATAIAGEQAGKE
jgi:hypothetical protein